MAKIDSKELDLLAGEVLPERTVLSALTDPSAAAPFSPFCSPNTQTVTGGGIVGANNQCGLENTGHASGIGILDA